MNRALIRFAFRANKALRFAYVAVVVVLAVFALLTYQELQSQRSAPVILPHYAFYILDNPERASVVQALGTWYVAGGSAFAQTQQTSSIECRKARLQCVESTAVVSVLRAAAELERARLFLADLGVGDGGDHAVRQPLHQVQADDARGAPAFLGFGRSPH